MKIKIRLLPYKINDVYMEILNLFLTLRTLSVLPSSVHVFYLIRSYPKNFFQGKKERSPKFRSLSNTFILFQLKVLLRDVTGKNAS